jgi:hypothetical protein
MKIVFIAAHERNSEGWQEDHETDAAGTPEEIIQGLLDRFNATLRPGELPRRLVRIVSAEATAPKPMQHRWDKVSLVTEKGGYDRMRCIVCAATGKRYGLGQNGVTPDPKFNNACPGYDL